MLRKSSSKAGMRGGDEPSTAEEELVKVSNLASLIRVFGPSCEFLHMGWSTSFGARQRNVPIFYMSIPPSL